MPKLLFLPIPSLVRELGEGHNGLTVQVTDVQTRDKVIGYVNRQGGPGKFLITPLIPRTDLDTSPR